MNDKGSDVSISRTAHAKSDVDFSPQSQHHTLGLGPNNAAAGNHQHAAVGDFKISSNPEQPKGWFECNGQAISRNYPLFDVLGTTFGVGDGSSTFNVPVEADLVNLSSGLFKYYVYAGGYE